MWLQRLNTLLTVLSKVPPAEARLVWSMDRVGRRSKRFSGLVNGTVMEETSRYWQQSLTHHRRQTQRLTKVQQPYVSDDRESGWIVDGTRDRRCGLRSPAWFRTVESCVLLHSVQKLYFWVLRGESFINCIVALGCLAVGKRTCNDKGVWTRFVPLFKLFFWGKPCKKSNRIPWCSMKPWERVSLVVHHGCFKKKQRGWKTFLYYQVRRRVLVK